MVPGKKQSPRGFDSANVKIGVLAWFESGDMFYLRQRRGQPEEETSSAIYHKKYCSAAVDVGKDRKQVITFYPARFGRVGGVSQYRNNLNVNLNGNGMASDVEMSAKERSQVDAINISKDSCHLEEDLGVPGESDIPETRKIPEDVDENVHNKRRILY